MAIDSLSKINSYQKISGLEDQIKLVRDLANTKLPLSGGTMTGTITMNYNEPYVVYKNKYVPTRVYTDLNSPLNANGYKYGSHGIQYKASDNSLLGGTICECIHDTRATSLNADRISIMNYLQLPISKFPKLHPNDNNETVATRAIRIKEVLKNNDGSAPYCEASCEIPYRNSDSGSQLVVQSWIRKNLTGLDRIAPDSTILWYNNSKYNVRFDQDGNSYNSSKTRPWIGYDHGIIYLKKPFTDFNRLWILFGDDSARYISTYFVDTYDLDLRMKSYFFPSGSSDPLYLGIKNGISTTEGSNVTFADFFHGSGNLYWNIFGYNTHSTVDAYKSTTSILKNQSNNCRCICIIGIGDKKQTTWNP